MNASVSAPVVTAARTYHADADDGPAISPWFFTAAMAIVLTAGAAWGVLLLWKISTSSSFTGATVHEVNAHGHAQIMGWVGLFIMGFAYRGLPRMWNTKLPAPRLAFVALTTMVSGIILRSTSLVFAAAPWAGAVHLVGIAGEMIAAVLFVSQLGVAFVRSRQSLKPYTAFAFAAITFFWVQTIYGGWHMDRLMHASDRTALLEQIATYQAPLRDMQIHGVAMLMIFAVASYMFPIFFNLPQTSDRRGWWAFGCLVSAVILEVTIFLAFRFTGQHAVAAMLLLPWLLLPIGAGLMVWPWRLWRPLPVADRSGKFIRAAYIWLFISFTLLLFLPVYRVMSGLEFSHAYYGAIRHAVTVGFISMMIIAMAAKLVATMRRIPNHKLPQLWLPFILLNLGCLLRVSLQIATDWSPWFFKWIGVSGMFEWTALALWAYHITASLFKFDSPQTLRFHSKWRRHTYTELP